ncbi:hypothetical protein AVEN_194654-1 [Araneus ventricosus]|uniref:Uncharacterized protein n=1 Tax=Araneus ventricosus TaxID=182803 RepID=A0A4Y2A7T3_ARAVE|nr:hypothetical protein AVEN_194654-1 [Araneus ventricosus]
MESEHSGTTMDLFIELKNEFASFRYDIYDEVDCFSKLLSPSTDDIQSDEPLSPVAPNLQQEIFAAEVKYKVSTYSSATQSTSALSEGILVPRLGWERFAFRPRDVNGFFSIERMCLILVPRSFRTSPFTLGSNVFLLSKSSDRLLYFCLWFQIQFEF